MEDILKKIDESRQKAKEGLEIARSQYKERSKALTKIKEEAEDSPLKKIIVRQKEAALGYMKLSIDSLEDLIENEFRLLKKVMELDKIDLEKDPVKKAELLQKWMSF